MSPSPDVAEIVARLRAGLGGVTPGPWTVDPPHESDPDFSFVSGAYWGLFARVVTRLDGDTKDSPTGLANLEHIALCSPENIRALIAAIDASAKREEALRRELEIVRAPNCDSCGEKVTADCPRPRDEPCWREFHKGSRVALSDGESA